MQIYDGRETFYQWDLNQRITSNEFKVGDEIHFFNIKQSTALVVVAYELDGKIVADVPNILLQSSQPITVYRYINVDDISFTIDEHIFTVTQRPKPTDYVYTETEVKTWEQLYDKINNIDGTNAVSYVEVQNLTDEQKKTARENIDALSVDDVDNVIHDAFNKAIENGEFQGIKGEDGVSATHSWNGTVLTVTSASGTSSADLKGEKGDKGDKGDDGKDGKDGADYILTDDDKSEIAAQVSGDCVSYSEAQDLTKEQKEIARNNIDAVDANLVVSSLSRDEQIPNGAALKEYTSKHTEYSCVRYDVQQYLSEYDQEVARSNIGAVSQTELEDGLAQKVDASRVVSNIISDGTLLSDNIPNGSALTAFVREHGVAASQAQSLSEPKKARARSNINAAEDAGKWELLYTIEGDGETDTWEFTKFADGSDLKLRAAAVKTINTVAASADTYGFIYAYDLSFNVIGTAVITRFLSKTAGAIALGIIEQDKGYYRAYAADGSYKNPGNVKYSGFQQYNEIGNIETTPYIPIIKVTNQTTAYLPAGSTIEVWGVKA